MRSIFRVFHPQQPTQQDLELLLRQQAQLEVTYGEIGASLLRPLPSGFHHLHDERIVGSGAAMMERGRDAIRAWAAQAEMGLVLEPTRPELVVGSVLVFALPMRPSPFWATGACRIVRVVDQPDCFGFAYGTLPHHPETGEEAFLVHHRPDDRVSFSVTAFSRASVLPMQVSGPVGRAIQRRAAATYLDGYQRAATGTVRRDGGA
jgi:uncharacterized protein (UPF0548 family)